MMIINTGSRETFGKVVKFVRMKKTHAQHASYNVMKNWNLNVHCTVYYSGPDAVPVTEGETVYWPSPSVLTARLRRLITASQRFTKSRQILQIHQTQSQSQSQQTMILSAPLCPLPTTLNDTLNPKMAAKIERQQRSELRADQCLVGK